MNESPLTLDEAVEWLADDPENPSNWLRLGHQYLHEGQVDGARTCYERALELDPTLEEARAALARLPEAPAAPELTKRQMIGGILILVLFIVALSLLATAFKAWLTSASVGGVTPVTAPAPTDLAGAGAARLSATAATIGTPVLLEEGLRLTLLAANPDAAEVVQASLPDAPPPPAGQRLLLARFQVENVLADDPTSLFFLDTEFEAMGESGISYGELCERTPEPLAKLGAELRRGEATEGNICLTVDATDPIRFLRYEPLFGADRRFFALPSE